MASKSVYQDVDQAVLQHFGLDSASVYGVLSSSNLDSVDTVYCKQDPDLYEKIKTLLKKETLQPANWKNYKRAFVLPKCPVSPDRIKSVAKEHNIVIVNDVEKADFIISHDDFSARFDNGETIKSSILLARLWNYESKNNTHGRIPIVDNSNIPCIYDDKWNSQVGSWNCDTYESIYDEWMFTGMAINIAYSLETNSLGGVVDIDSFMHQGSVVQPITEDLIDTIKQMSSSYSDDDREIVGKIIPTIDRTQHHHLLWKLLNDVDSLQYNFNRNKDVQYWLDNLLYPYRRLSAESMIIKLEEDKLLNKESFRYLEPIVRKEIRIVNRDLYVFKVSVKPKYQDYL